MSMANILMDLRRMTLLVLVVLLTLGFLSGRFVIDGDLVIRLILRYSINDLRIDMYLRL